MFASVVVVAVVVDDADADADADEEEDSLIIGPCLLPTFIVIRQ
jgi:hypothetical protein